MKTAVSLLGAAGVVCLLATPLAAQAPVSPTLRSQREAVAVLSRAIAAEGGYARLRAVGTVAVRARVTNRMVGQEVHPDSMTAPGTPAGGPAPAQYFAYLTDASRSWDVAEQFRSDTSSRPGLRLVRTASDRFVLRLANNTVQSIDAAAAGQLLALAPYVPATLLAMWDRPTALRSVGRQRIGGTAYDMVNWADESGQQMTLFFDARTALLSRVETVTPNEPFGLGVQDLTYSDYRPEGDIVMPHAVTSRTGGRTQTEMAVVSVDLSARLDSAILSRPQGATAGQPITFPSSSTATGSLPVNRLAEGIYSIPEVMRGYLLMFADAGEYSIVIEADGNPALSESVLRTVRETIPGKPVRYVVLTHHHSDHSGGLWAYIADNVTVVTTPGDVPFVRSIAAQPRAWEGRVVGPLTPVIETVTGRRSYGSGPGAIEVYDVGPNPHAQEILVVYFPAQRLLYVPDIYGYFPGFTPPNLLVSFADKLATLGLDIQNVLPAHAPQSTWAEFQAAVAQARTQVQAAPR